MNCDCGGKSLVLETRNTPTGAMARKRRCKVCGQIFWTGEIKTQGEPEIIGPHVWANQAGTVGERAHYKRVIKTDCEHNWSFRQSTVLGPMWQCTICGLMRENYDPAEQK